MIEYKLEIVGGPWDGVRGLSWTDDGDHPVPERIWIGMCRGDQTCSPECRRRAHVSYWTAGEDVPTRTDEYEKETEFVERVTLAGRDRFDGVARYAIGGLPRLESRDVEERVPAGAGGVYAYEIIEEIAAQSGVPLRYLLPLGHPYG